ncbi:hypothetical protein Syun_015843 [Stephania yunnanensis]|uniref:Poly(A) RNA polymerase mitochondrial-like central palm domain-containing protein n=1 Tax=Stephania yunnanensis TaxID=152371 RepID=A0AAP0P4B0_9MAGN
MSSSYDPSSALEICLREALLLIKPLHHDEATRVLIIDEFKTVVNSVENLRDARVEPFGSFVSKLYSKWGDLDIFIEMPGDSPICSVGKKRKQIMLSAIKTALQTRGIARRVRYVPNARVPLLTFESTNGGISCDISVNNQLGLMKSRFLFWISEIDERFHNMVLLVKEWAKSQNINNPKLGTLNSYSLCLMIVFHFQTCEPAILPPLKEFYTGDIVDDLTGMRGVAERNIEDIFSGNIRKFRTRSNRNPNRCSLSELFVSFFQKFSRIKGMALRHAICPYTGKWEPIMSNYRWMAKSYPLLIEDPFEQPENTARSVGQNDLTRISEVIVETLSKLSKGRHEDQRSVVTTLVRPQLRPQFFARTQGNLRETTGGIRPHVQVSHTVNAMRSSAHQAHTVGTPNGLPQRQQSFRNVHPIQRKFHRIQLGSRQYSPSMISSAEGSSSSEMSGTQNHADQLGGYPDHKIYSERSGRRAVDGRGDGIRWRPKQYA